MPPIKVNEFLEEVLSYIKLPFVKDDIKLELESHVLDKISDYMAQGYNQERAQQQALADMGDPKEIGTELNRQHNPFLGWVLRLTNIMVIFFLICSIYLMGFPIVNHLFRKDYANDIPKENIVYKIDIDEKVKIDDTIIHFTNVIYEKDGDLSIFYEYYDTRLRGMGWTLGGIGDIGDNLGNTYFSGQSGENGGIKTRGIKVVRDFSKDADTLIIKYDYYNRKYKLEIPLKVGDTND